MKFNSFEELAILIANSKKDKKAGVEAKSKSPLPATSERCSIDISEEKARHKEELNRQEGFSSTGIKLPSKKEMQWYHEKREVERENHEKFLMENPERKRHGKMIIYIAAGGLNKRR